MWPDLQLYTQRLGPLWPMSWAAPPDGAFSVARGQAKRRRTLKEEDEEAALQSAPGARVPAAAERTQASVATANTSVGIADALATSVLCPRPGRWNHCPEASGEWSVAGARVGPAS